LVLIFGLSFGGTFDAVAQTSKHQRKSKKPKPPPCRTGCKPETSEPRVAADTPEDEAGRGVVQRTRELGKFFLPGFIFRRIGRNSGLGGFRFAIPCGKVEVSAFLIWRWCLDVCATASNVPPNDNPKISTNATTDRVIEEQNNTVFAESLQK